MKHALAFVISIIAMAAGGGEIVTYRAPPSERQDTPYQIWAGDQQVDVYAARTLDPPFAGKQWDFSSDPDQRRR